MTTAPAIRKLIPDSVKRAWWYCTDSAWREAFQTAKRRQDALRKLQLQAFQALWAQSGGRIVSGPFLGLVYLNNQGAAYPQKLLGTYEKELWPAVKEITSRGYELVVDIGAAEGYYVCGLATRMPQARVIAFEAQSTCHRRIRQLAQLNEVQGRIECRGICRPEDLQEVLSVQHRTLIVCDVEGAEWDLLDPSAIERLRNVDLLVEVHDHLRPDVGQELKQRFQSSHHISVIPSSPRTLADMPAGIHLPEDLALAAMEESRGGEMVWHWMQRK